MIVAMHYLGYDAAYEMTHCLPSSAVSIQILEFGVYRFMLSTCQNMGTNRNYLLLEGINQYNPSTQVCISDKLLQLNLVYMFIARHKCIHL